jgi:serine/threonine protein kinase/tetratricopeptide (TPR) repeat protein
MAVLPDVKSVFGKALELASPADRAAYLGEVCGGDSRLRGEVEGLLSALDRAGRFMSHPPAALPDPAASEPDEAIGTVIGPYTLVETLGEGGMGTVYLAEQEQPVKRRVALKLIKAGIGSPQAVARFDQERQTLALMDHPNIAQVLDAGTISGARSQESEVGKQGLAVTPDPSLLTPDSGRSYVVMELVNGVPITRFCDQERLTPRERLELFLPVCHAVQHAHQKGIIHRDLKPSNVLIALYDGRPVPKVIDFGVAKAVGSTLSERAKLTEVGVLVGTLEYMAPEQAELNNLDIDTRADIYSLGVLLYELLTGSPPFTSEQLRDRGFAEMLRLVKEVEPPKPSTRLSTSDELARIAATRRVEPKALTRLLTGELDWIVMKCLEKERDRRYETAEALAADIGRHLADEPVSAGPPSAGYRVRKFVRRNRRGLAAGAAFVLLLVTAVVTLSVALVQTNRERQQKEVALDAAWRRQQQARSALDAMTSELISDWLTRQPALTPEQKEFLTVAVSSYEEFAADTGQQEQERAGVAHAYLRVGAIRERLGQRADAQAAWHRAQNLYAALVAEFPGTSSYRQALAEIHFRQGIVFRKTGRLQQAEQAYDQALGIQAQLTAEFPEEPNYRKDLARTLYYIANVLEFTGRRPEAEQTYRRAVRVLTQLVVNFPDVLLYRYNLAGALKDLSMLLDTSPGRSRPGALDTPGPLREAAELLEQSVALYRQLLAELPAHPDYRDGLSRSLNVLGNVLRDAGQTARAESAFRESIALRKHLTTAYPMDAEHRRGLAIALNNLGILLKNDENDPVRMREAEEVYRQALAVHQLLLADFPGVPDHENETAGAMVNLGRFLLNQKDFAGARRLLAEALPHHQAALKAVPHHAHYRRFYRTNRWRLAETLLGLKDHAGAAEAAREFLEAAVEPPRDAYTAAGLLAGCVRLAAEDEHLPESERQALAVSYGDRALTALRQAIKLGAEEVEKMKTDNTLDPLRHRADFQQLLAEQK